MKCFIKHFIPFSALCDPPCRGGICVEPNVCLCRDGRRDRTCDQATAKEENHTKSKYEHVHITLGLGYIKLLFLSPLAIFPVCLNDLIRKER